ncbi:MAG TPA: carboxypeptidase-like regulatory domain-containing protein [Gemmatimonadaceae bacterium]|nr:carboxypeptidase-like regulatory domain-containing protein [Gemmatimonadaceae bacterium]
MQTSTARSSTRPARLAATGLLLLACATMAQAQAPVRAFRASVTEHTHGVVHGIVLDDSTRAGLLDASLVLVDANGELAAKMARTDSAGFFELIVPATGHYRLVVRREGYLAVLSSPITMEVGEAIELEVPLATGGDPRNSALIVSREPLSLAAWVPEPFARRQRGGAGTFVGPEALRRARSEPVGALLARLGGGAACQPAILVNGEVAQAEEMRVLQLSTAELRAIEYYRGGAVPAELASSVGCALAVLWTR